jgi:hypothetical protein
VGEGFGMTTLDEAGSSKGLVERVKAILLQPGTEWDVIQAEQPTIKGLYKSYIGPLAAIPAVAGLIGMALIGVKNFGLTVKTPILSAAIGAVVQWGASLIGVYVLALIIEALAPNFGGEKNRLQAFKLVAYSYTAAWVAGILLLLPNLAMVAGLLGLYSLFLLYKGVPKLMKAPEDKALPYTAVAIVAAMIVYFIVFSIVGAVVAALPTGSPAGIVSNGVAGGTVKMGDAEIDLGKLEAQAKQLQAQVEGGPGAVTALSGDVLKGMLPAAIAGLPRTEVQTGSGGMGGLQASNASATYEQGDSRISLSINDSAGAGGLMGLAGAMNVNSSSETATGYEKVTTTGGRMVQERYDRQGRSGEYSILVGSRFMVQAEGSGVTMDQLKGTVGSVDLRKLESLAKG